MSEYGFQRLDLDEIVAFTIPANTAFDVTSGFRAWVDPVRKRFSFTPSVAITALWQSRDKFLTAAIIERLAENRNRLCQAGLPR